MVENKMGTARMSRLVISMGLPLTISLLINSLYNFVDSVFVSRVSEEALTALSLAAPIQILVSAMGLGNAVGLNAVISKALGEKKPEKVKNGANAAVFIALCSWVIIAVLGMLLVNPYFAWQSGGNETIARYGGEYLTLCMIFSFGQMGQWVFDRFVIASGKSQLFLLTLSVASLTNLFLDPILIFGLFGLPRLETLGAAIATVIGQIMGMVAGILINRKWNVEIPFSLTLHPDGKSVRAILKVGVPSTLVQVLTSFVSVALNSILLSFSATAVAIYGICMRVQSVVLVGVHGIDNGLIPIVAYNFGAKKDDRIHEAVMWGMIDSGVLYLTFFLILEAAPTLVLGIFEASPQMLQIGIPALRILATAYLISIPNYVLSSALQGLSRGTKSMYLTMIRQAILPILFAMLLQSFRNANLMWIAFVLAEVVTIPIAVWLWKRSGRKEYE